MAAMRRSLLLLATLATTSSRQLPQPYRARALQRGVAARGGTARGRAVQVSTRSDVIGAAFNLVNNVRKLRAETNRAAFRSRGPIRRGAASPPRARIVARAEPSRDPVEGALANRRAAQVAGCGFLTLAAGAAGTGYVPAAGLVALLGSFSCVSFLLLGDDAIT